MEISEIFFYGVGFGYRSEVVTFSKGLEFTYQSIFFSSRWANINLLKRN